VLREQTFDESGLRQALADGFWAWGRGVASLRTSKDLRALYATKNIKALVDAVEGSPMLLALAVLWLEKDANRSVASLLNAADLTDAEERDIFAEERRNLMLLVAHRLTRDPRRGALPKFCGPRESLNK
jgi:hypothetical protein